MRACSLSLSLSDGQSRLTFTGREQRNVSSPSSPRKDADGQRAGASIVQQLNLPAERERGKEREEEGSESHFRF